MNGIEQFGIKESIATAKYTETDNSHIKGGKYPVLGFATPFGKQ